MVDELSLGVFSPVYGHFKRFYAALCPKVVRELIAHDSPRKRVRDQREVQEARSRPDVRDVADPYLLRPGNLHRPDQVRVLSVAVEAVGGPGEVLLSLHQHTRIPQDGEEPVPAALDPLRRQSGRKQVVQLPAAQPAQNPALGGHQTKDGSGLRGHPAFTAFGLVVPLPGYPE